MTTIQIKLEPLQKNVGRLKTGDGDEREVIGKMHNGKT
jgi:hypothetical protein